jgi:hypothetical protein
MAFHMEIPSQMYNEKGVMHIYLFIFYFSQKKRPLKRKGPEQTVITNTDFRGTRSN